MIAGKEPAGRVDDASVWRQQSRGKWTRQELGEVHVELLSSVCIEDPVVDITSDVDLIVSGYTKRQRFDRVGNAFRVIIARC